MKAAAQATGWRASLRNLDRYWFGRGSPVSLAVFRIIFGTLAFANLCMIAIDFDAWFTERGFVPWRIAERFNGHLFQQFTLFGWNVTLPFEPPRLSLLSGVVDSRITLAFYALTTIAALFTALGLWTRVSTILLALGMVSLHHRNMIILHGGDTVLRVGVLYLALAPCGLACSLDRMIGLWRGKAPLTVPDVSLWTQRLIAYNVALVYFTTFWHKLGFGSHWKDLTATWYPARLHEFERFPVPAFFNSLWAVRISTLGTLVTELALGTIVFYRPARRYVLFLGLVMHGYIEYSMNIPLFAFLICSMYIAFYDGEEVVEWAKRVGQRLARFKVTVFLPQGTRLRPGPGMALQGANCFDLVSYEPGADEQWHARRGDGTSIPAARASWTRSPGAWIVGWAPGIWRRVLHAAIEPVPVGEPDATPAGEAAQRAKVRR